MDASVARFEVVRTVCRAHASQAVIATAAALVAVLFSAFTLRWQVHLVDPGARAAVETTVALMALLGSALLVARIRHRPRMHELLLLSALLSVALTDFVFSALPALSGWGGVPFGIDARLAAQAVVPVTFALAAVSSRTRLPAPRSWRIVGVGSACLAVVAALEVLDLLVGRSRILAMDDQLSGVVNGVEAAILVAAGVTFLDPRARGDQAGLLAAACFLLAAVRMQAVAIPAVAADWVTPREPLRMVAYGLLLAAAAGGYAQMSRNRARAAVSAERERIARDIHDGLAQDLATIAIHAQRLDATLGPDHPMTVAARRALASSRGTIVDLSASHAPTTDAALCEVADELGARFGIEITVIRDVRDDGHHAPDLVDGAREQTVRIAREAIVNAARHGRAQHVEVTLQRRGARWLLRVSDDGTGIDPAALASGTGFGINAMRARADELGGQLTARRRQTGGTVLELSMARRERR